MDMTDKYQKEVYIYAQSLMKLHNFNTVVDVGCGSGYKLVKYLGEYDTTGIETEPCISFLRKKYPSLKWLDSGEAEKSFKPHTIKADVVICSDVIEHIVDPDNLIEFLLSIDSTYYVISTPCRNRLVEFFDRKPLDAPINKCHVREWTMDEFKQYISKRFTLIESHYAPIQKECQFHLLKKAL
jgi:SAM-dependent methyltransferase